jgi:hypothetical protein
MAMLHVKMDGWIDLLIDWSIDQLNAKFVWKETISVWFWPSSWNFTTKIMTVLWEMWKNSNEWCDLGHLVEATNKSLNPTWKNPRSCRLQKVWMSKWSLWIMPGCAFSLRIRIIHCEVILPILSQAYSLASSFGMFVAAFAFIIIRALYARPACRITQHAP